MDQYMRWAILTALEAFAFVSVVAGLAYYLVATLGGFQP